MKIVTGDDLMKLIVAAGYDIHSLPMMYWRNIRNQYLLDTDKYMIVPVGQTIPNAFHVYGDLGQGDWRVIYVTRHSPLTLTWRMSEPMNTAPSPAKFKCGHKREDGQIYCKVCAFFNRRTET